MVAARWSWMMRAAPMHHSGGMPGSFLQGRELAALVLGGVALAAGRPLGGDARVVGVTTLSDWMKASRKSSSASNRSALVMPPLGSFSWALPSAISLLTPWS